MEGDPAAEESVPGRPEPEGCGALGNKDPRLHLIANIIGSVPLQDEATRNIFLEVMRFCHGEHGRLFPKVETRPDQFVKLGFGKSGILNEFPTYVMRGYDVPNMLFGYLKELKESDRSEYFKMAGKLYNKCTYGKIITAFIRSGDEEGIEIAMDDLVTLGPESKYFFEGLVLWFSISTCEGFCKGIEFVCDRWEIPIEQRWRWKFFNRSIWDKYYSWAPLSDPLRDRLCSDDGRAVKLFRVYSWFSMTERDFDALYDLARTYYDKIGVEEVQKCLKRVRDSFSDTSLWTEMKVEEELQKAKAYLTAAREFMRKMEGFLVPAKLDACTFAEFGAVDAAMQKSMGTIDEYLLSIG